MPVSLRDMLNCLGIEDSQSSFAPRFSLLTDFLGFWQERLPSDPTNEPVYFSILEHINNLRQNVVNLNIVWLGDSMHFSNNNRDEVDYWILRVRFIFGIYRIGIGRILHLLFSDDMVDNLTTISSAEAIHEVLTSFHIENDSIDIFVPQSMFIEESPTQVGEASYIYGPCPNEKNINNRRNGLIIRLIGNSVEPFNEYAPSGMEVGGEGFDLSAVYLAHEIGHYLGLEHYPQHGINLMVDGLSLDFLPREHILLTEEQVHTIRTHCMIRQAC